MPEPKKNEKQEDFLDRCIPELVKEGFTKPQSVAICFYKFKHRDDVEKKK